MGELGNKLVTLETLKATHDYNDLTYVKKADLTSPFIYKGSCLFSELPLSGNQTNDTYYCTDKKTRYTWNGSAWSQSSMSEVDYADELSNERISRETADNALADLITSQGQTVSELSESIDSKIDTAYVENGYLILASGETVVAQLTGFGGGSGGGDSGGGSTNDAVLTFKNNSGWLNKNISSTATCTVYVNWSSIEDELQTGMGVLSVSINGVQKFVRNVDQGDIEIELKEYLSIGANKIKLTIEDVYGNSKSLITNVNVVSVSISSSFDGNIPQTSTIEYFYVPVGNMPKNVFFKIDGALAATQITTRTGVQQSISLPAQSHGSHTLEVYFTAMIDDEEIESNHLFYDLICIEQGNPLPIVASEFNETSVEQYDTISIPFSVYNPNDIISEVVLSANGRVVNTISIDRSKHIWSYRPDSAGELVLSIATEYAQKTFTVTVQPSSINVEPVTENMDLYLTSYGRSNGESNPSAWEYNSVSAQLTNFNFVSDGWTLDDDNITALRVAGDARVEIPYKPFEVNCTSTGLTVEIEFAVRNVMNYDAVLFDCMEANRGIKITAQRAYLASEGLKLSGNSDYKDSCLQMQYKENEHVRLAFVISKIANQRLVYSYINGVLSGLTRYPVGDDFAQLNPVNITIGSNDCVTDIYNIRVYKNDLTRQQVLNNWIADTQIGSLRKIRYESNDVFDDYGQISIDNLSSNIPYMVLVGDLPTYKGDKKTISGYYVDPTGATESFVFDGASADVQGTSSAGYPRKNFKIKFTNGFNIEGRQVPNYSFNEDAIPVNTFTFKADYASCEGCNNVELVDLYELSNPSRTFPQLENPNVRQGIAGHPIVMFHNNGYNTEFLGKYNFNNDKGTSEVFGFKPGDESWETLQNTTSGALWKSVITADNYAESFEARYPEDNTNLLKLKELSSWLSSTDTTAATGVDGDTAENRLKKFHDEFENYFNLENSLFYYIFTELFLMVDSRAKNSFPTIYEDNKWVWLPYDMDTALGTNNEGLLLFDYNLEDTDLHNGSKVYNGQDSVMWNNLRDAFGAEIEQMYRDLRTGDYINYDYIENKFETHQSVWPPAIFNEDAYYKYVEPLIESNSDNLDMCQGSKEQQRKWWLYNRFKYMDSKYNAGYANTSRIMLRAYQRPDSGVMNVVPYADIYTRVAFDSLIAKDRTPRNTVANLQIPESWNPNGTDSVVYIYSADQLKDVGDLSGFYVGYADFSGALKLQSLKLGDASPSYRNENLTSLQLGANILLKTIDVRNSPNLSGNVDVSGCANVEELYFDNTSITGITLPNGGALKTLHLPNTVANLTIRNMPYLENFVIDGYDNITTLVIENTPSVDAIEILSSMEENSRIRILGFNKTFSNFEEAKAFFDVLETMRGLDENGNDTAIKNAVRGTIFIDTLLGSEYASLKDRFPSISVTYNHISSVVYFYSKDGSELLGQAFSLDNSPVSYPNVNPTAESTAQYLFSFSGWAIVPNGKAVSDALTNIQGDKKLYAAFISVKRKYTVTFYNSNGVTLYTVTDVNYGTNVVDVYPGTSDPIYPNVQERDSYAFKGWDVVQVVGDTKAYAQYKYKGIIYNKIVQSKMDGISYENDRVSVIRSNAFYQRVVSGVSFANCLSIGGYAFYSCTNLKQISFPKCKQISADAFYYCTNLSSIYFPQCESVGYSAFYYCTNLTEINFPECKYLGAGAFQSCYKLVSVSLPKCETLDNYAFANNTALSRIELPECITINSSAFNYCTKLSYVSLPKCENIGTAAFSQNSLLTEIYLPNCKNIYNSAFASCTSLTTVNIPICSSLSFHTFSNCSSLSQVNAPACTYIGISAFYGCTSLKEIELPACKTLADYAFYGCSKLASVSMLRCSSFVSYGNFVNCFNLQSLYLLSPSVATLSYSSAFNSTPINGYWNTTYYEGQPNTYGSIYVLPNLVSRYKTATNWRYYSNRITACDVSLISSDIELGLNWYGSETLSKTSVKTVRFIPNYEPESYDESWDASRFCNGVLMGYRIGNDVVVTKTNKSNTKFICDVELDYMFSGMTSLSEIDVSMLDLSGTASLTYMFQNCSSLTSMNVDSWNVSNVLNFGYIFTGCTALTSLDLSSWDTSKATNMADMFYNCSKLLSLNISNFDTSNVTDMGSMFYNCKTISSLDLSHFNTSRVTSMIGMFDGCNSLTSLDVSSFDTSKVYRFENMFRNCQSLTSLNLKSFNFARAASESNNYFTQMFYACYILLTLRVGSDNDTEPQKIKSTTKNMFASCPEELLIYVPQHLVEAYKAAPVWSQYADQIVADN